VIDECLELALQAPSGGNSQRWRFVVLTDPDVRASIAELYRRAAEPYLDRQLAAATTDRQRRVLGSARYLLDVLDRVPVLVIPCLEGRPSGGNQAGFFGSILPAAWSFCLALRSRGLGSVWTTLHLQYESEAADLLGIPAEVTQAGLIPVAYTIGQEFKPAARLPLDQVRSWNGWSA
jgi:nitroreductase